MGIFDETPRRGQSPVNSRGRKVGIMQLPNPGIPTISGWNNILQQTFPETPAASGSPVPPTPPTPPTAPTTQGSQLPMTAYDAFMKKAGDAGAAARDQYGPGGKPLADQSGAGILSQIPQKPDAFSKAPTTDADLAWYMDDRNFMTPAEISRQDQMNFQNSLGLANTIIGGVQGLGSLGLGIWQMFQAQEMNKIAKDFAYGNFENTAKAYNQATEDKLLMTRGDNAQTRAEIERRKMSTTPRST